MDGWENSQAAGQSQLNSQYQHPWPQFSPYNHVPWTSNSIALSVIATPGVSMAGQYFTNQGAQVFNSFPFVMQHTIL